MKRLSLVDKALLVIEALAMDEEVEYMIMQPEGKVDVGSLIKKFCAIYEYAHVARGTCGNPHKDWVKHLESTYAAMHKHGVF